MKKFELVRNVLTLTFYLQTAITARYAEPKGKQTKVHSDTFNWVIFKTCSDVFVRKVQQVCADRDAL